MIDTLSIVRRLEAAKMPRQQAEAVAAPIRDGASTSFAELATKLDLEHLRTALKDQIDALRTAMRAALRLLEQRMAITLGSMLVVAMGATAAVVKLL
jgi:hypothetical protein